MANARNRAALCLSNYVLAKKVVMCDTKCIADITTLRVNFAEARISHFFTLDNNIDAITLKSMVFETDGRCRVAATCLLLHARRHSAAAAERDTAAHRAA